jgi:hypothetical protein
MLRYINNTSIFLYLYVFLCPIEVQELPEDDQDRSKHVEVTTDFV